MLLGFIITALGQCKPAWCWFMETLGFGEEPDRLALCLYCAWRRCQPGLLPFITASLRKGTTYL